MLYAGCAVNNGVKFVICKFLHLFFRGNITVHTDNTLSKQFLARIIEVIHQHMHHSFLHGLIFTLTYQTVNLTVIIIQVSLQNMNSQEAGCTCDHDITNFFLCHLVYVFFHISADHALDPVIIVAGEFVLTLRIFKCLTVIHDCRKLTDGRIFEDVRIYNGNILGKAHNSNF